MALSVEQASWFGKQRLHERLIVINNWIYVIRLVLASGNLR
jgi:hypothetical protein